MAKQIENRFLFSYAWVSFLSLLAAVSLVVLGWDVARNIYRPTRLLFEAVDKMARGELEIGLARGQFLEFAELAASIRRLRKVVIRDRNAGNIDAMSGLPNRAALFSHFKLLMPGNRAGFALIDIDRFKQINDDYGHNAGDALIRKVGIRLNAVLPAGSFVARLGGDELCAYIPLPLSEDLTTIADRAVREMRVPFDLGVARATASISLGITSIAGREGSDRLVDIMKEADLALYVAKNGGRNKAVEYDESMSLEHSMRRSLEHDLTAALERGELRMVYQPIQSLNADMPEVEALVRWMHPAHGNVSPATLIDVAERSGQMTRLGDWIINKALSDIAQWPDLSISINLSVLQLQAEGIAGRILEQCKKSKILPNRVTFEVTETIALTQNDRALVALGLLKGFGFRVALDDFGAGYSSLWLLKTFEFDRLKLDRSLIYDLTENESSLAVFETAVMLGRRLGLDVVAEGVANSEQMALLSKAGCTHLQGYFLSRPLEIEVVADHFYGKQKPRKRKAALA